MNRMYVGANCVRPNWTRRVSRAVFMAFIALSLSLAVGCQDNPAGSQEQPIAQNYPPLLPAYNVEQGNGKQEPAPQQQKEEDPYAKYQPVMEVRMVGKPGVNGPWTDDLGWATLYIENGEWKTGAYSTSSFVQFPNGARTSSVPLLENIPCSGEPLSIGYVESYNLRVGLSGECREFTSSIKESERRVPDGYGMGY